MARRADTNWFSRELRGLPEVSAIGRGIGRQARVLGGHEHRGSMEICYVESGRVSWWAGRRAYDMVGGECYVTRPDEPHGGVDDAIQPAKIYWLILKTPTPSRANGFLGLPAREATDLVRRLTRMKRRSFPAPQSVARLYDSLLASPDRPQGFRLAEVRSIMVMLLAEVVRAEAADKPARDVAGQVRLAVEIMRGHLDQPLAVPEIAELVGWSASHFKMEFRRRTGQTPADYYLRLRVSAALDCIRSSGSSLAAVAQEFGFSSSQYLATCVRRITGRTPSSYRP